MVYLSTFSDISSCPWVYLVAHFFYILIEILKWSYLFLFFFLLLGFHYSTDDISQITFYYFLSCMKFGLPP